MDENTIFELLIVTENQHTGTFNAFIARKQAKAIAAKFAEETAEMRKRISDMGWETSPDRMGQ